MGAIIDLESVVSGKADQAFRDRWTEVTAVELATALPPVPWVCEELGMAPGAVTIIGGAGFGGKTLAMQAFLLAVASGRKAWGQFTVAPGRVVHIDFEQGRHLTQLRYQRIANSMGVDVRDLQGKLSLYTLPEGRLDEEQSVFELVRLLNGARIALIDAFRGAFPSAKENDSGVRHFLDMLQKVSDRTGCMIVVIAHSRKMSDDVDVRSSLRGSGALFDAAQTIYMLDGTPKKCARINNTKDRWLGENRDPFGIRIADDPHWDPNVDDRRWGLRVEYVSPPEVQAEYLEDEEPNTDVIVSMNLQRAETLGNRLLGMIASNAGMTVGMMKTTLRGAVSTQEIEGALHFLQRHGTVHVEGKGPNAAYVAIGGDT